MAGMYRVSCRLKEGCLWECTCRRWGLLGGWVCGGLGLGLSPPSPSGGCLVLASSGRTDESARLLRGQPRGSAGSPGVGERFGGR